MAYTEQKTNTKTAYVGDLKLTLTSNVYDGEIGNTKVELAGEYLCTVAGSQRDEFAQALGAVVDTYRI